MKGISQSLYLLLLVPCDIVFICIHCLRVIEGLGQHQHLFDTRFMQVYFSLGLNYISLGFVMLG